MFSCLCLRKATQPESVAPEPPARACVFDRRSKSDRSRRSNIVYDSFLLLQVHSVVSHSSAVLLFFFFFTCSCENGPRNLCLTKTDTKTGRWRQQTEGHSHRGKRQGEEDKVRRSDVSFYTHC